VTTTTSSRGLPHDRVLNATHLQAVGGAVIRHGLAGVIGWIGLMKFTRVEAEAIWPLAAHSPLMAWAATALSVRAFPNLVGVAEVTIAGEALEAARRRRAVATAATGDALS
jgi:hypothetical protein